MRFCTWNVTNFYKASLLTAVAREVSKDKVDLVGVQEVRWDGGGTKPAGKYTRTFFYEKGHKNHDSGTGVSVHKRYRTNT
jgi:exonuclease III